MRADISLKGKEAFMKLQNDVIQLSYDEMIQINGGELSLPGWLMLLSIVYDFGHGFYDGFTGRPTD